MQHGNEPFAEVRQLLALKRHETPPPGFFDRLPHQVRLAILSTDAAPPAPWLDRLRAALHWRPALAGACAALAVSVVVWRAAQSQPAMDISSALLADEPPTVTLPQELNPWLLQARSEPAARFAGTMEPSEGPSVRPVAAGGPPRALFRPQIGPTMRASSRWSRLSDSGVTNVSWR